MGWGTRANNRTRSVAAMRLQIHRIQIPRNQVMQANLAIMKNADVNVNVAVDDQTTVISSGSELVRTNESAFSI